MGLMMLRRRVLLAVLASLMASQANTATITVRQMDNPREAALLVEGDLLYDDADAFRTKIAPYSKGLVVLRSDGGNALAGIEIGRTIRLRNFITWVPSGVRCASACASAWLGGTTRLMGKDALVGFHAAYREEDGRKTESGAANAILGGYLAQLGLSDRAIFYITASAPSSMRWLSLADAERVGIEVGVYDPGESNKDAASSSPRPSTQSGRPLREHAVEAVTKLYRAVSSPPGIAAAALGSVYAQTVRYYGKDIPREKVMEQVMRFIARWPERAYVPQPETIVAKCDDTALTCEVRGHVKFDARSVERNQRSFGVATFEYALNFRDPWRPEITFEHGSIVERQMQALWERPDVPN